MVKLTLKVLAFDVILPIVDKIFDFWNIYNFYSNGDHVWMGLTILVILLPGLLESLYWLLHCMDGQSKVKNCLGWSFFFGPVLFPFSTIFWHFFMICRGEKCFRKKYDMSMVLNSLQAFSESAYQFLLQTSILMMTWRYEGYHFVQLVCAGLSCVILAKACVEHHFFEISGKTRIPKFSFMTPGFFVYLFHVFTRTLVIALLASYLHWFCIIPLVMMIILNFFLAMLLKTDHSKNIWTAVSSVPAPICFVSKDSVHIYTGVKFHRFYFWNSALFLLVTGSTLCVLNFLLWYEQLDHFNCENLPFLSCYKYDTVSGSPDDCARLRLCDSGETPFFGMYLYGSVISITSTLLDCFLSWTQNCLCPSLRGDDICFMSPL